MRLFSCPDTKNQPFSMEHTRRLPLNDNASAPQRHLALASTQILEHGNRLAASRNVKQCPA